MLIFKINGSGQVLWSKTIGGNGYEEPYRIINTQDGNLLIAGYTSSFGPGWNSYLYKLSQDGDSIWEHAYGTSGNDRAYGVVETSDGYVFAGQTETPAGDLDVMVAKADKAGNQQWIKSYGGAQDDYARWISPCADGGFGIVGTTQSYGAGGNDVYLIKIDAAGESPTAINEVIEEPVRVDVFPNPAHASFTIKTINLQGGALFNLTDVTGKAVKQNLALNGATNTVSTNNLSAGVYFYSVADAGGKVLDRGKLMIQ
jgi:type IX secretion system substrate protein